MGHRFTFARDKNYWMDTCNGVPDCHVWSSSLYKYHMNVYVAQDVSNFSDEQRTFITLICAEEPQPTGIFHQCSSTIACVICTSSGKLDHFTLHTSYATASVPFSVGRTSSKRCITNNPLQPSSPQLFTELLVKKSSIIYGKSK